MLNIPQVEWLRLKDTWLSVSDCVVDPALKELIRTEWDAPPTALQLAKVLKAGCYLSITSNFTMRTLVYLYQAALAAEGTSEDDIDTQVEEWFLQTYPVAHVAQVNDSSCGRAYLETSQGSRTAITPSYGTST